jgi:hypothetical protein
MAKILRITLSLIVVILGIYGLLTSNFTTLPYLMFFLALMSLVNGISELQKQRKPSGILSIFASVIVFFVLILTLIR